MKTYQTEKRARVTDFLKSNAERQFTIEEIADKLSEEAGKSTVYRLVSRLCDEGVVRRIPKDGERGYYYQAIANEECFRHLHMKCLACGKLVHLAPGDSMRLKAIAAENEFSLDSNKAMIYGYCLACAPVKGKNDL